MIGALNMNLQRNTKDNTSKKKKQIPNKNPKRSYSKHGCIPCKKAHIKCSEEKPICNNCKKSDKRVCTYHVQYITKSFINKTLNTVKINSPLTSTLSGGLIRKEENISNKVIVNHKNTKMMKQGLSVLKFDIPNNQVDKKEVEKVITKIPETLKESLNSNNDEKLGNILINNKFDVSKLFSKDVFNSVISKKDNELYSYKDNERKYQFIDLAKVVKDNNVLLDDAFNINNIYSDDPIYKILHEAILNYKINTLSFDISLDLNDQEIWEFAVNSFVNQIYQRALNCSPKELVLEFWNLLMTVGNDFNTIKNTVMFACSTSIAKYYSNDPKNKLLYLIWNDFIAPPWKSLCVKSLISQSNVFRISFFDWLILGETSILLFDLNFRSNPMKSEYREHIKQYYNSILSAEASFLKKTSDFTNGELYLVTPVIAGLTYFQNVECILIMTSQIGNTFEDYNISKEFLKKKIKLNSEIIIKNDINIINGYYNKIEDNLKRICIKIKEINVKYENCNIFGINILSNKIESNVSDELNQFGNEIINDINNIKIPQDSINYLSNNDKLLNKRITFNNHNILLLMKLYVNGFMITNKDNTIILEVLLNDFIRLWGNNINERRIICNGSIWTIFISILISIKLKSTRMIERLLRIVEYMMNNDKLNLCTVEILLNKLRNIDEKTELLKFIKPEEREMVLGNTLLKRYPGHNSTTVELTHQAESYPIL